MLQKVSCGTLFTLLFSMVISGCIALSPVKTEDEFGHRIDGVSDDGRQTILISPPDEAIEYRYFDATFETVSIRPARVSAQITEVPVEVLIKGSFPDSCSELHKVVQQRAGNIILVTLTMRRPQGAVCASVLRPYRYYLDLDGKYVIGSYSMKLNETSHPFVVRSTNQ